MLVENQPKTSGLVSRRKFLKMFGLAGLSIAVSGLAACGENLEEQLDETIPNEFLYDQMQKDLLDSADQKAKDYILGTFDEVFVNESLKLHGKNFTVANPKVFRIAVINNNPNILGGVSFRADKDELDSYEILPAVNEVKGVYPVILNDDLNDQVYIFPLKPGSTMSIGLNPRVLLKIDPLKNVLKNAEDVKSLEKFIAIKEAASLAGQVMQLNTIVVGAKELKIRMDIPDLKGYRHESYTSFYNIFRGRNGASAAVSDIMGYIIAIKAIKGTPLEGVIKRIGDKINPLVPYLMDAEIPKLTGDRFDDLKQIGGYIMKNKDKFMQLGGFAGNLYNIPTFNTVGLGEDTKIAGMDGIDSPAKNKAYVGRNYVL